MTIGFGEPFGSGQPIAEMSDSATAPAFSSFEELKAAIETEPTIVSTALLIQAVQSRLQRPSPAVAMSDDELEAHAASFSSSDHIGRLRGTPKDVMLEEFKKQRAEHQYLRQALVKLEERAFGRVQRGLGAALACSKLTKLEVKVLQDVGAAGSAGLAAPPDLAHLCTCGCAHKDVFDRLMMGDLSIEVTADEMACAARHCSDYTLAPTTDLARAYYFLDGPFIRQHDDPASAASHTITETGQALLERVGAGQVEIVEQRPSEPAARRAKGLADDYVRSPSQPPAVADPVSGLPDAVKALFSDAAAFERELAPQVGGDSAEPMRGMLGAALSMLVQHYDVAPRQLADYVREVLRFTYPEAFQ